MKNWVCSEAESHRLCEQEILLTILHSAIRNQQQLRPMKPYIEDRSITRSAAPLAPLALVVSNTRASLRAARTI